MLKYTDTDVPIQIFNSFFFTKKSQTVTMKLFVIKIAKSKIQFENNQKRRKKIRKQLLKLYTSGKERREIE